MQIVRQAYGLLLFQVIMLSCNGQATKGENQVYSDTVRRIILYKDDSASAKSRQQPFVANLAKLIGLPALSNGQEGFHGRIWFWDFDKKYIVDIAYTNVTRECTIIEYGSLETDSGSCIQITREWTKVTPRSGWANFFDSLATLKITALESGTIHNTRGRPTHSSYVQFEIVKDDRYKFYEYLEPSFYRFIDEGSRNVYRFLRFLNEEMNVKVYEGSPKLFIDPGEKKIKNQNSKMDSNR